MQTYNFQRKQKMQSYENKEKCGKTFSHNSQVLVGFIIRRGRKIRHKTELRWGRRQRTRGQLSSRLDEPEPICYISVGSHNWSLLAVKKKKSLSHFRFIVHCNPLCSGYASCQTLPLHSLKTLKRSPDAQSCQPVNLGGAQINKSQPEVPINNLHIDSKCQRAMQERLLRVFLKSDCFVFVFCDI